MTAKVWEEKWDLTANDDHDYDHFVIFPGDEDNAALLTSPRARLIAAAPEMARMLLELEWNGWSGWEGELCCPVCHACDAHVADCRLVAILRKAGVLP